MLNMYPSVLMDGASILILAIWYWWGLFKKFIAERGNDKKGNKRAFRTLPKIS